METKSDKRIADWPKVWISGTFVGYLYEVDRSGSGHHPIVWLTVYTEGGLRNRYGPFEGYLFFNPEVYTFEEFEQLRKDKPEVYKYEVVVEGPKSKQSDEDEFIDPVYDIKPESLIKYFEAVALKRLSEEQRNWLRTYLSSHRVERGR